MPRRGLPSRSAAGAHVAPPWDALANASEHAPHEPTVDASMHPSQLLRIEVLRRPIDSTQYLRVYMVQLRRKLERDPANPRYLVTEPGVGYRLKVAADPVAEVAMPERSA
jgi:Transcriptional regulatory protein, C terminal